VKECLDTGWVSSVGKFVDEFEDRLANYTGCRRAIAVVNGTAALQICLKLVGVAPGDEVLVPALSFVATANAVTYCGAIPHFVDCEERTLGLDPAKLEDYLQGSVEPGRSGSVNRHTGRRIKAVVPMHTFGHPVDLDPLGAVCARFGLEMVEDAAESLGSLYKGVHTGNRGRVAALSFNGNKTITTGGGGAILTNDAALGKLAKHLTTTARVPHKWNFTHDLVGYNYRLPNINAALGCAQLEQLPTFLENKRALAGRYKAAFKAVGGLSFFSEPDFALSNYWLNTLVLDEADIAARDDILEVLNTGGVMARPAWTLLSSLPMYADCPKGDLRVARRLAKAIINIPSSPGLLTKGSAA
jgi:perosamine synthetase